jgi:hypothetical protein
MGSIQPPVIHETHIHYSYGGGGGGGGCSYEVLKFCGIAFVALFVIGVIKTLVEPKPSPQVDPMAPVNGCTLDTIKIARDREKIMLGEMNARVVIDGHAINTCKSPVAATLSWTLQLETTGKAKPTDWFDDSFDLNGGKPLEPGREYAFHVNKFMAFYMPDVNHKPRVRLDLIASKLSAEKK